MQSGLVQLFRTIETEGRMIEVELARVGPHDMFGEMALIDHQRRSSSARTLAPTELVVTGREVFEQHLRSLPPWVLILIRLFVRRIRESNRRLLEVLEVEAREGKDFAKHLKHGFVIECEKMPHSAEGEEMREATRSLLRELGVSPSELGEKS